MLTGSRPRVEEERGATALIVAAALLLLLGLAAIGVDLGAGFNERRQDQTAADTGVMAGAVAFTDPGTTDEEVSEQALAIVRQNLDTTYSDAEWQALWRGCVDPERTSWDPGTGTPISFSPMPEPPSWGGIAGATIDCLSKSSSFLRIRVPDQNVATSFGRVLGVQSLTTHAFAVALVEPQDSRAGLLPFGISGGATPGELCLTSSGSGTAHPPCAGPSSGSFGPINSEIFGDFFGTPNCGNPGDPELAQNIALGIDHFLDVWGDGATNPNGVVLGSPHPGDVITESYTDVTHDQCRIQGGVVGPQVAGEEFPPNLLRVLTGFPQNPVEEGLVSNATFNVGSVSEPSRLQQECDASQCATANETRTVVKRRQGANNVEWDLNNVGPWEFLTSAGAGVHAACNPSSYAGLTEFEKATRFDLCLENYSGTTDIFSEEILDSPRFAWAPQYWHLPSTSGLSWQPVYQYRMVFLGGIWFNCDGAGNCGVIFYPDSEQSSELCDVNGSQCQVLSIGQLSGWLFPDEALPDLVRNAFPGGQTAFEPKLFR